MIELFTTFNRVKFIDENHTYLLDNKRTLTSVTTFIGQFKDKFDEDYWLPIKAAEYGVTEEELKKIWDDKRDLACFKGSKLHNFADNYLHNRIFSREDISDIRLQQFLNFYNDFSKTSVVIRTEFVLYDEELGLGGMIDLLCYNFVHNYFFILDYKTNEKLKTENIYQRYKSPLNHLQECEFNTYSLQTSIYKYIIEKNAGIKIKDSYLVWLTDTNDNYKLIKCPYLLREIKLMFDHNSSKITLNNN